MRIYTSLLAASLLLACGGGSSTGTTDSTSSADSVDGTWDITAAGEDTLDPSQMTIKGGQVDGVLAVSEKNEGVSSCDLITSHRYAFTMTVTGDSLVATFTETYGYGAGCTTTTKPNPFTITATRAHDAKNAEGSTAFEGDWSVADSDGAPWFGLSIIGLVGQAWGSLAERAQTPTFTAHVANNQASTTSREHDLTFAARRR